MYGNVKTYFLFILIALFNFSCSALLKAEESTTDNGRFWAFVQIPKAIEDAAELRLWATLPPNHRGQKVSVVEIYPEPSEIVEDSLTGNRTIFWRITDFKDKEEIEFYYDFIFTRSEVLIEVDLSNIGPYDKTSFEYQRFTQSEPWIELTSEIEAKAQEIVGDESNPYLRAKAIFNWVIKNMSYEHPVKIKDRGVANSFKRLKGDCGEFSVVFCAMCRSLEIPARTVTCACSTDFPCHQYAEFKLPGYGWLPVDTALAYAFTGRYSIFSKVIEYYIAKRNGMSTTDYNYLFGNLYTERLIVCIGNNIEVNHPDLGISKTFRYMQPGGGLIAYPPAVEAVGLPPETSFGQIYIFGKKASDKKYAKRKIKHYRKLIIENPNMKSTNISLHTN